MLLYIISSLCIGCSGVIADIVLLVDISGSLENPRSSQDVTLENYNYLIFFIVHFIRHFDIRSDKTRFGLVTFSETANNFFYLNTFSTEVRLTNSIYSIRHEGGGTNIAAALALAMREQFTLNRGDRPDVPNFAVLLTYNTGTIDTGLTSTYAQQMEASGIKSFTIGITDSVSEAELSLISSRPKKKQINYFLVPDFSHLRGTESNIVKQITWYTDYGNTFVVDCYFLAILLYMHT